MAGNKAQTHCIRGHEFTPENTKFTPHGTKKCRECNNEYERLRFHADPIHRAKKIMQRVDNYRIAAFGPGYEVV